MKHHGRENKDGEEWVEREGEWKMVERWKSNIPYSVFKRRNNRVVRKGQMQIISRVIIIIINDPYGKVLLRIGSGVCCSSKSQWKPCSSPLIPLASYA